MPTVLLAWELGAGTGHCVNLLPIAKHFVEQGVNVHVALRDVCLARVMFGDLPLQIHQAPFKLGPPKDAVRTPRSFAHILHNTGFANYDELRSLVEAWLSLFHFVRPDLVVFDHSPSGLLASQLIDVRRATVGTGFFTPPDVHPLPDLRPWMKPDPERITKDEDSVHNTICRVLESYRHPGLDNIAALYRTAENLLLTFPELDPYGPRDESHYWGSWTLDAGARPAWPELPGKKLFAYLRPFASLPNLLSLLEELRVCALLYIVGMDERLRRRYASRRLRFVTSPLKLAQVAKDCELAILNGNAGTTTTLLWHGLPSLHIPTHLEQATNAHQIAKLGAGLGVDEDQPERMAARLIAMLRKPQFAERAKDFSKKYADHSPNSCRERVCAQLSSLL